MQRPAAGGRRSRGPWSVAGATLTAALVLASCQTTPLPASPEVVAVAMGDYRFSYDRSISPGRVVFRARNDGQLTHELVLVDMPEDFPLSIDAQLHSSKRQAFPTRAYLPPRPPGSPGTFAVDLQPGRYALVCFVADPDGQQHALKGMSSEFRVR